MYKHSSCFILWRREAQEEEFSMPNVSYRIGYLAHCCLQWLYASMSLLPLTSDRNNTKFATQIRQSYSSRYTVTDACCSTCWRRCLAVFINIIALNHTVPTSSWRVCIQFTVEEETNNTVSTHKGHPPQGRFPNNQCMFFARAHTRTGIQTAPSLIHKVAMAPPYSFKLRRFALMYQAERRSMHACSVGPPQQWLSQKP